MRRPTLEVADIFRAQGDSFVDHHPSIHFQQLKVIRAITQCRTAALGGHIDKCSQYTCRNCDDEEGISFNSCRNRACPKCQGQARQRWIDARERELLATSYFHVVFTLPHELHALIWQNTVELFNLLFRAAADTLLEVAANPKHLGAEIDFFAILHTWGQNLQFHPHIHCVVPAGGLAPDRTRWIRGSPTFFLPMEVLSVVFRGKFVDGLTFVRIRHFGFMANYQRSTSLDLCRKLLGMAPLDRSGEPTSDRSLRLCPRCGSPMTIIERLTATQIRWRFASTCSPDTS